MHEGDQSRTNAILDAERLAVRLAMTVVCQEARVNANPVRLIRLASGEQSGGEGCLPRRFDALRQGSILVTDSLIVSARRGSDLICKRDERVHKRLDSPRADDTRGNGGSSLRHGKIGHSGRNRSVIKCAGGCQHIARAIRKVTTSFEAAQQCAGNDIWITFKGFLHLPEMF